MSEDFDPDEFDEDYEDFIDRLGVENLGLISGSVEEIKSNFQVIDICNKIASDARIECETPNLSLGGTLKENISFKLFPQYEKKLKDEYINFIKDIQIYREHYIQEAKKLNETVAKLKEELNGLSKSSNQLSKQAQDLSEVQERDAKAMIIPLKTQYESVEKIDQSKLDKDKKEKFETKNKNIKDAIHEFDNKCAIALVEFREILKKIKEKVEKYYQFIKNLSTPVSNLVNVVRDTMDKFEKNCERFSNILPKNKDEDADQNEIGNIFTEIKQYHKKIIQCIKEGENNLDNQQKELKTFQTDFNTYHSELQTKNEKLTKSFQELSSEGNKVLDKVMEFIKEFEEKVNNSNNNKNTKSKKIILEVVDVEKINEAIKQGYTEISDVTGKIQIDLKKIREFSEEHDESEEQNLDLDLVFVMDITGSMGRYLQAAKKQVISMVDEVKKKCVNVGVKVGFVGYYDKNDSDHEYINIEISENINEIREKILQVEVRGGSDCEDMAGGLKMALEKNWTSKSRFLVLIADMPCHGEQFHEMKEIKDSLPQGESDPSLNMELLVKQIAEKDICMMCLNITKFTLKLFPNFLKYYKKGKKEGSVCSVFIKDIKDNPDKLSEIVVENSKEVFKQRHGPNKKRK